MKSSDIKKVFSVGKSEFGKVSEYSWDWSISKIRQFLRPSFGVAIVCSEGKEILGFALAEKKYSSQKPAVAWLNYVFVKSGARHRHIGSKLVEEIILRLKKGGKKDLITDVYANNKSSLKFFKSNNFVISEKWFILSRKI